MTNAESIKVLEQIRQWTDYPKEALTMAIEALSKPSLPSNLYKAAVQAHIKLEEEGSLFFLNIFKAGAEWMAGQGYSQEEIVEDKSIEFGYGVLSGISPIINLPDSFKPGDKVVVQIRKKQ